MRQRRAATAGNEHGDGDLGQGCRLHARAARRAAGAFTLAQLVRRTRPSMSPTRTVVTLGTVTATDVHRLPRAPSPTTGQRAAWLASARTTTTRPTIVETEQSASKTVTVCVGKDLTVAKTAAGTFDRAYLWKISKDVDQTAGQDRRGRFVHLQLHGGGGQTGVSDSGWTLAGKITVHEPERLGRHHADEPDGCGGQRRGLHGRSRSVRGGQERLAGRELQLFVCVGAEQLQLARTRRRRPGTRQPTSRRAARPAAEPSRWRSLARPTRRSMSPTRSAVTWAR